MQSQAAAAPPAVLARGLGRRFGRLWALAHLDLEVAPGEVLLLAGANGSGKTTLLRLLAGLDRPTSGAVSVFGGDPRRDVGSRRRVTMVSHHGFLYDRLTALETLRFWSRAVGAAAGVAHLRELLAEVGLAAAAEQQVGGFSAGMRKRLTLLRTRIESPDLVLWDEPFSALDADGRRLLARWTGELVRRGASLLLATHDLDLGADLCPRALVLDHGQLRWRGPSGEVAAALEAVR
jgi:ABC-2 type transport system ATP-binding protein